MATAPRKPAARRINGDTPPSVKLNLDTYEYEEERPEPFTFVLGGTVLTINDPVVLDWQDAADINDPFELADKLMSEKDRKVFLETKTPMTHLRKLVGAFQRHYGMDNPGNAGA